MGKKTISADDPGGRKQWNFPPKTKATTTTKKNTNSMTNITPLSSFIRVKVTDILYEMQTRRNVFHHFSSQKTRFVNHRCEETSFEDIEREAMNNQWQWLNDKWLNAGNDSWQYATKWYTQSDQWSYAEGLFDLVKRRKWWRERVKLMTMDELNDLKSKSVNMRTHEFIVEKIKDDTPIHGELDTLSQQLQQKYIEITANTHKPNILLLGGSGAGKSSLVNAVFGKPLAEIGEGKPITQKYTKFAGAESPVVIYDSKGIEHGYIETGFLEDTRKFFKRLRSEPELEKHIHVVWYVIDLTQARFQPFEATFCRDYLRDIPIIFVLNKADAVTEEVKNIMIRVIKEHNLPNVIGIYPTIANCKNFDSKTCPKCGSSKIRKKLKSGTCTIMCKECQYNVTLEKTSGIDHLSRATLSVMPDLVKEVYILSQKSNLLGQEAEAKKIIEIFAADASMIHYDRLEERLRQMTKKLVELYQMKTVSSIMEQAVLDRYNKFFHEQRFSKKAAIVLSDLFNSKKNNLGQSFIVAAGLEVANLVLSFKNAAIQYSIRSFKSKVLQEGNSTIGDTNEQQEEPSTPVSALDNEKEWFIEKLVSNMELELDSVLVSQISEEIRKFNSMRKYLNAIAIDGSRQYKTPDWEEIKRKKMKQEEEDRKAMTIPLYTYQKVPEQQAAPPPSANT